MTTDIKVPADVKMFLNHGCPDKAIIIACKLTPEQLKIYKLVLAEQGFEPEYDQGEDIKP